MSTASPTRRGRGRPPGPPVDQAARREQLLNAAEQAIAESGVDMSLAQVADNAGLTRSAVYASFADRDALLGALGKRHSKRMMGRLQEIASDDLSPYEQTRAAVEVLADWFENNPDLVQLLDQRPRSSTFRSSSGATVLTAILAEGFKSRDLDPAPAPTWANGLIGTVSSAVRWWVHTQEISRDEMVNHLTSLIWSGFSGTNP